MSLSIICSLRQAQLATLQESLADAERRVFESELIRRKLHNTIQVGVAVLQRALRPVAALGDCSRAWIAKGQVEECSGGCQGSPCFAPGARCAPQRPCCCIPFQTGRLTSKSRPRSIRPVTPPVPWESQPPLIHSLGLQRSAPLPLAGAEGQHPGVLPREALPPERGGGGGQRH